LLACSSRCTSILKIIGISQADIDASGQENAEEKGGIHLGFILVKLMNVFPCFICNPRGCKRYKLF
jgi:hypothetical protein